jgi:hypothetical protein
MDKRNNRREDAPIRGPEWSTAKVVRTSFRVVTREVKDFMGLQHHLNSFVDTIKKGVDAEAATSVKNYRIQQSKSQPGWLAYADDTTASLPSRGKALSSRSVDKDQAGAFAFLNGRKRG